MQPETVGRKRCGVIFTVRGKGLAVGGYRDRQSSREGVQSSVWQPGDEGESIDYVQLVG